jgi:TatD DNase family protein
MSGFDSHCHVDFMPEALAAMADAEASGIGHWLVPGTEPKQWRQARQRFGQDARVHLGAGHHPWFLPDSPADTGPLVQWLDEQSDCVAIGEIGLDFFKHSRRSCAAEHQEAWFSAQLDLACERQLPVIIHSVKAHDRILHGLNRHSQVTGVVHGFVGPYVQAMAYIDRGLYLGAGSVVFRSDKTLDAFCRIPSDRILIETDAPDQRHPYPHSENALLDWHRTLERLAELRQLSATFLTEQVRRNARTLFGC